MKPDSVTTLSFLAAARAERDRSSWTRGEGPRGPLGTGQRLQGNGPLRRRLVEGRRADLVRLAVNPWDGLTGRVRQGPDTDAATNRERGSTGRSVARTLGALRVRAADGGPQKGGTMPVGGYVRDEQQPITALDAHYPHDADRLEQAVAHRTDVLAEHERLAVATLAAVDQVTEDMANQLSSGLAAQLLGAEPAQMGRLANAHAVTTNGSRH